MSNKSQHLTCVACKSKVPRERIKINKGFCDDCIAHTKLCDCDCGEEIFSYRVNGQIKRYVNKGHANRDLSEETRAKISRTLVTWYEDNEGPMLGRKHTVESRASMSKSHIKRLQDPKELEKQRQNAKIGWDKPGMRVAKSEEVKEYNKQNPNAAKERGEIMAKHYVENPDAKEYQRQIALNWFEEHPEFGVQHSEHMKALYENEPWRCDQNSVVQKERWKNPEYRIAHSGENSTSWKGGISFEPYGKEFNEELREFIRARQSYQCASDDETCKGSDNKALDCHHIDGDKRNNSPYNLVALCSSHHARAEHDPLAAKRYSYYISLMYFEYTYVAEWQVPIPTE